MDDVLADFDIPPIPDNADRYVAATGTTSEVIDLTSISKKAADQLKKNFRRQI